MGCEIDDQSRTNKGEEEVCPHDASKIEVTFSRLLYNIPLRRETELLLPSISSHLGLCELVYNIPSSGVAMVSWKRVRLG